MLQTLGFCLEFERRASFGCARSERAPSHFSLLTAIYNLQQGCHQCNVAALSNGAVSIHISGLLEVSPRACEQKCECFGSRPLTRAQR